MQKTYRTIAISILCGTIFVLLVAAVILFLPEIKGFLGINGEQESVEEKEIISGFKYSDVPEWDGSCTFVVINDNVPFFTDEEKAYTDTFAAYSELDELGRCGAAFALLDRSMVPEDERGDIFSVYPSGWNQEYYEDLIEDGALYNRCHLIAYALTGENDNPLNLITGTRFMNVEGMENGLELEVIKTIHSYPQTKVLYRVTPVFVGDELVCRGVLMEALSGDGSLKACIFCYNVQPGVTINYADGSSHKKLF